MEVNKKASKKPSRGISDFRRYHHSHTVWFIALSQFIAILSIGAILSIMGVVDWLNPMSWIAMIVAFAVSTIVLLMAVPVITDPLYDILAALSHKVGEPSISTPPNPNAKHYEKTGMKNVLQAIYSNEGADNTPAEGDDSSNGSTKILTEALNHTSCGVVILNSDKEIISANAAAPIGYDQRGKPFLALDFMEDEDIMSWIRDREDLSINAEKRWSRVSTNIEVLKKQRIFDIVASYEKGATAETVIFLIDQSNNYLPEEEDLNFIAFAAHELRGPITVIRGYLDILEQELQGRLEGDEPELLQRLIVSANRLSSYVSNILGVAKYDRHHLKVELYEDTVSAIYASIADDMQMRAQAQHRLLNIDIPEDLPTVAADRGSIGEVIGNMIDNAIKYSFEGGVITVKAEVKGEFIEVSVIDNGIGMPANVVNNLFRKFYRSHRSRETVAGTGIGLYISRAFIESHGGSISVRSKEGRGSTFSFTLPIYATVADKLLEDGQVNKRLIRKDGGWIKNHAMHRS